MRKFKSPKQAQRFLPVHGQIRNLFGAHRYKMDASDQRKHLLFAWDQWQEIVTQAKFAFRSNNLTAPNKAKGAGYERGLFSC